jgi:hypothetical protein
MGKLFSSLIDGGSKCTVVQYIYSYEYTALYFSACIIRRADWPIDGRRGTPRPTSAAVMSSANSRSARPGGLLSCTRSPGGHSINDG